MPAEIDPKTAQAAVRLSDSLARYAELSKKTIRDVVWKKGVDLGVQLYRNFSAVKWGGNGKAVDIGLMEMRQRAKSGRGIVFPKGKDGLGSFLSRVPQMQWVGSKKKGKAVRPLSDYQRLVAAEIARRQVGRGALAASFLFFRKRRSQAKGTFIVKNKTGRPLGSVVYTEDMMRISSRADGIVKVAEKHNIIPNAMNAVTADMQVYIERKLRAAAEQTIPRKL